MLETDLPRIEDRWQDDDWTKATLDLTEYLFWLDESQGWHWLVPRLVESSVYKLELWRGLVEIPNNWVNYLGYVGKKRLKCLRSSMTLFRRIFKNAPEGTLEAESEFIEEFTRLERSGWLKGDDEDEHRAMLDLLRGNFLCHRGLYKKALAQYEIVDSRLPVRGELLRKRLAEAYSTLGWILDDEGYYEEAIAILQHAIELDSEDITLLDELGGMYADSDHTEEAINIFRHAIELNPEDSSLYYSLALALRDAQQFDEAIETCVHILKLESNDLDALNGLGYLYIQTGDMTKAELYLEKALQTKPLFALSLLNLGIVKWRTGRIDAAKTLFSDALNKIRAHADTEKATLGWLQVVTGDIESGLQNIRQALEKNASAVDKSNMRDWTNALVIAASPPEGLEQILEIVKDTRTNR